MLENLVDGAVTSSERAFCFTASRRSSGVSSIIARRVMWSHCMVPLMYVQDVQDR